MEFSLLIWLHGPPFSLLDIESLEKATGFIESFRKFLFGYMQENVSIPWVSALAHYHSIQLSAFVKVLLPRKVLTSATSKCDASYSDAVILRNICLTFPSLNALLRLPNLNDWSNENDRVSCRSLSWPKITNCLLHFFTGTLPKSRGSS